MDAIAVDPNSITKDYREFPSGQCHSTVYTKQVESKAIMIDVKNDMPK